MVRNRLAQVAADVTHLAEYDYVLVNNDFEESVARVAPILAAERLQDAAAAGAQRVRQSVPDGRLTRPAAMPGAA